MRTLTETGATNGTLMGYVVPEFPGQTHIFFWREIKALTERGIVPRLISTRRPDRSVVCHDWSEAAMARTRYLFPPGAFEVLGAIGLMVAAGPVRWARMARVLLSPEVGGVADRVRLLGLALMGAQLARLAEREGWTHAHVHSCGDAAFIGLFASMFGHVGYSLSLHSRLDTFGRGQSLKWRGAEFGTTVTERLKKEVLGAVAGLGDDRVEVVPMGVEVDVFRRSAPYEAFSGWAGGESLRTVTCGRLVAGKGHQDLIRAVGHLGRAGKRVTLRILGEGPARPALERLIVEEGLTGAVCLAGAVAERIVLEELGRAHVFALASHEEALGVATMEAMAMELPVVVTRVGGVGELVREGVDGLMVTAQRPEEMAVAIDRVAGDAALAVRLGRSGAERVRREFGSTRSAEVLARRILRGTPAAQTGGRA